MDWSEFAKELEESGFFEICGETPQNVTDEEIQNYGGLMSWAEIQAQKKQGNYETERLQVLDLIKGKTHLSFSLLTKINEIRFPRDDRFGKPQGRYEFGRYFETALYKQDTSAFAPSKAERELCKEMCVNAWQNEDLTDWLESECAYTQHHFEGVLNGYKIHGFLDFFADCLIRQGADVKTTKERTLRGFEKSCHTWFYFAQAYIYTKLSHSESFTFFASSKTNKKLIVFELNEQHLEIGRTQFEALLANLEYYKIENHFKI